MKKIQIIPCLDMKNGRVVKGVQFVELRDAGDPVECALSYEKAGATALAMLDISATNEERKTRLEWVKAVTSAVKIPVTVGGGISTLEDIKSVLDAGASRVSINTAAVRNPYFVQKAVQAFGGDKIIVALDVVTFGRSWQLVTAGGSVREKVDLVELSKQLADFGASAILLTSMDRDGTKAGYDLGATRAVADAVDIPVIASGGAGTYEDFALAVEVGHASAVLAASLFHFGEVEIPKLKEFLQKRGIEVE